MTRYRLVGCAYGSERVCAWVSYVSVGDFSWTEAGIEEYRERERKGKKGDRSTRKRR